MPLSHGRRIAASATLLAGAALLAGCGGTNNAVGNTQTGYIRSLDTAVNAGTCNVIVNGASVYGDQTYFGSANNNVASPYEYIGGQNGISLTYTTSQTLPDGATQSVNYANTSNGSYYTSVLVGSFDANYNNDPNISPPNIDDPRLLQVVLLPARGSAPGGQAALRVTNAAPDLGFSQLPTSAGQPFHYTTGTVTVTVGTSPATTFTGVGYASTSGYQTLAPGANLPVTVALTSPTTGQVTTRTQTITLSANTVYTLFLTEPSDSPEAYDLRLLPE